MNNLKKTVLSLLLALPFGVFAQLYPEHHWQPELSDFNMTATFAIRIDGVMQTGSNIELGAFSGDICRSSFHLVHAPFGLDYYITEGYNIQGYAGEVITFRLYDHLTEREMDVVSSYYINFVPNLSIGSAQRPQYIDFITTSASYYTLVTDESQLVSGRQYLIGNGFAGTSQVIGWHDDVEDQRVAVNVSFANRKTCQQAAVNVVDMTSVYQFTLGGEAHSWTLYDVANKKYLNTNKKGSLKLGDSPINWDVTVAPTGEAKISAIPGSEKMYLFYDEDDEAFYCDDTEQSLYLFARCEIISGSMAALNVTDVSKMYVVESGNILTADELSTVHPSNLIVEDSAQLITKSAAQVTIQKNISAYADAESQGDWYTLASPVTGEIESASNMIYPDFDLFFFRENIVRNEWRNYKNPENEFVNFESGRGYLYANSNDLTLNFKGTMNTIAATYAMTYTDSRPDDLKGFALVGNPFAHNIKKGSEGAIDDDRLATGYYTLTHSGVWEPHTDDEMIAPCQGILIQTSEAGDLNINNVVASQSRGKSSCNACLVLEVVGEKGRDKSFVYFGEGVGLNKMAHFIDAPMLYLRQNSKDYAIAHYDANATVGEIPVFFEASENGKYVISVANDGLGFDYLHLVDNLTGEDVDLLDTAVPYTFSAKINDYAARFKLVYQMHRNVENQSDDFCYFADGRLVVPFIDGENTLQIIDMTGRIISSQSVNGSFNEALNLNTGVYVVRMGNRTQKIVVR